MTIWHVLLILFGILYFTGEYFNWKVPRKNYNKDTNYELIEHKMFTWSSSDDCLVASIMVFKHKINNDFVFDYYNAYDKHGTYRYSPEDHSSFKKFIQQYEQD